MTTPHSLAMNLENTADMLAAELWERYLQQKDPPLAQLSTSEFASAWLVYNPDTQKSLRRTMATLQMVLDGDIRSPQNMAAEVDGRVSE